MDKFEYKISVIVPVYNGEKYLRTSLNSLLVQTLDNNDIEVLMINDGSRDNSEYICKEYTEIYSNFKLFSKENEGLSATRNFGIKKAEGKYICYLDADDTFSRETLKNICDFFDKHYDEIDEVTYPIVRYKNGKTLPLHYRYKFLNKTGIYDLEKEPFISQTNINICVKNKKYENILFDVIPGFRHEDQAYNNSVLKKKMKIGFVKEAEYQYNRDNDASIINTYMYPYYIFESTMDYYENLFSQFDKEVPKYYQALYINDLNWKLCADKLYPFHYSKEKFECALNRIKALLARCDADVIINHPTANNFHIQYWLNMKPNIFPTVIAEEDRFEIVIDSKSIYKRDYFEIILHKVRVCNGELRALAFVKSPIYNYLSESAEVYVVENGDNRRKLDVFISVHSYFRTHYTQTNNFYAFDYRCDVKNVEKFYFEVQLDGIVYKTKYWCMPTAVFDIERGVDKYVRENVLLSLKGNEIFLERVSEEKKEIIENQFNQKYKNTIDIYNLRERSLRYRKKHKIWLYYDAYTVKKDNGYYQFLNDFEHSEEDGIERYYITFDNGNEFLFNEKQRRYLVRFGSDFHKLLYLSCERVFTAFYGFSTISPFKSEKDEANYADLIKFKTIYLQHGVLHAALHTYNSVERCRAEQIVVSSQFEVDNYKKNYNYSDDDLILTGMARYDFIKKDAIAKNRILYAPSWRKYLTFSERDSNWTLVKDKLLESDYFTKILEFLNNERLDSLLKENDLYLDVKLHPIISGEANDLLQIKSERIHIIVDDAVITDYKLFITDFSSYVFDFACLGRPILYYVTDYEQFRSGMNHYKELDLEFDDAFGPLCVESESAVAQVESFIKNNFETFEPYKTRLNNFFIPLENCREKLYEYVMRKDKVNNYEEYID